MMKQFWRIVFASTVVLGLLASSVGAHGGEEEISKFDSQIVVAKDSTATITETISYDFGTLSRHGIQRFVPVVTKAGDTGKNYYYNFKLVNVKQDGHGAKVSVLSQGSYKVMRIGDPNRTITGVHVYELTYQMDPVVERTEERVCVTEPCEGDYFNWNLTGNQWQVPIDSASIDVSFPAGVSITNTRCYSGTTGSTEQECVLSAQANKIHIDSAGVLGLGEGLTLNALLPANSFSNYLIVSEPPPPDLRPGLGFAVGALALALGVLVRIFSYLRYQARKADQTVIPQYEGPDGLSPGEIGLLNDNRSNMVEITATLIDLAVRGYIKINQTSAKTAFKKAGYRLDKLKDYSNARQYERELLDAIFDGEESKALSQVSSSKVSTAIAGIQEEFKQTLENKGYYAKITKSSILRRSIRNSLWLIFWAITGFNIYLAFQGKNITLLSFSTAVAGIGLILGWFIGNRKELSKTGYEEWAKVEGLKLFLTVAEKDRLKFHNAPQKNPKLFNKLLPYAIALGVEKQWAKQFEGMDINKETTWYSSNQAFTAYILADSLSGSFSSSVSSNFAPPTQSSSSSGFSGGGFSGGGGGGGGGGSW